jgi:hypothetical protein
MQGDLSRRVIDVPRLKKPCDRRWYQAGEEGRGVWPLPLLPELPGRERVDGGARGHANHEAVC